jgi:hypothetical protein
MITYKQLAETIFLENRIFRGEYWIQDGYTQFADADVGDIGHEAIVVQHAASIVLSELDIDNTDIEYVDIRNYDEDIFEAMQDGLTEEQLQRYRDGEEVQVMIEYGKTVLKDPKFEKLVLAAFDKIDVRRFAMETWGWKAIRGNVVDTWNLTPDDLKKIDSGVSDAYGNEINNYQETNKDTDEHGFAGPYFDIEVYSVGDYYSEVPLLLIESKNVAKLRPYKIVNKGVRIAEAGELVGRVKLTPKLDSTLNPQLQTKLNDLSNKYSNYLDAKAYGYNEYIELKTLMAKKDAPIGTGSSYMNELCKIADEHNIIIVLLTANKGHGGFDGFKKTSSVDRLKRFYARFGFVSNYARKNYRPNLSGNMHRLPQK